MMLCVGSKSGDNETSESSVEEAVRPLAERDIMAGVVLYTDQSNTAGETCPDDELFNFDIDVHQNTQEGITLMFQV